LEIDFDPKTLNENMHLLRQYLQKYIRAKTRETLEREKTPTP